MVPDFEHGPSRRNKQAGVISPRKMRRDLSAIFHENTVFLHRKRPRMWLGPLSSEPRLVPAQPTAETEAQASGPASYDATSTEDPLATAPPEVRRDWGSDWSCRREYGGRMSLNMYATGSLRFDMFPSPVRPGLGFPASWGAATYPRGLPSPWAPAVGYENKYPGPVRW